MKRFCKHKCTRQWKTKAGWTQKCLECGRLRTIVMKTPAADAHRKFMQGISERHADGSITTELIDVTTCLPDVSYQASDWRRQ